MQHLQYFCLCFTLTVVNRGYNSLLHSTSLNCTLSFPEPHLPGPLLPVSPLHSPAPVSACVCPLGSAASFFLGASYDDLRTIPARRFSTAIGCFSELRFAVVASVHTRGGLACFIGELGVLLVAGCSQVVQIGSVL